MNRALAGLAAALLCVPVAGCSAVTQAFVPQIKVGQCTPPLKATDDQVDALPTVGCEQAHAWEAYAATELTDKDLPAEADLQGRGDEFCAAQFETFMGISYDDSTYDIQILSPTKQTWLLGDREIMCLVGLADGGVTGSLKGSGK